MDCRDECSIALTHICQAWREIFVSRSSLWTNFDCANPDKTRVYLERSKSSPINLWLDRDDVIPPGDPFLQIIPHSVGRLKSLTVTGTPENLQNIAAHLSLHAPLLERLDVDGGTSFGPERNPTLTTSLFNGNLSSLRELRLQRVRTELPWRNTVNLTSFTLCLMSPGGLSIRQLLDFFESAPRLRKIVLYSATPASGGQYGRLVSLGCLKRMDILWGGPSSFLLDHLLIPVGAKLTNSVPSFGPALEDYLPRSLESLRNTSNFTKVTLLINKHYTTLELSGPNGQLRIVSHVDTTHLALESLTRFDTSKVERLEIFSRNRPLGGPAYKALLPLENLRTLTLSRCENPYAFIFALYPDETSSKVMACPKLEELVLVPRTNTKKFDIESVIGMAAARGLRGAKLGVVRIAGEPDELDPMDASELMEHVLNVEHRPEVGVAYGNGDGGDGSDEEY